MLFDLQYDFDLLDHSFIWNLIFKHKQKKIFTMKVIGWLGISWTWIQILPVPIAIIDVKITRESCGWGILLDFKEIYLFI